MATEESQLGEEEITGFKTDNQGMQETRHNTENQMCSKSQHCIPLELCKSLLCPTKIEPSPQYCRNEPHSK